MTGTGRIRAAQIKEKKESWRKYLKQNSKDSYHEYKQNRKENKNLILKANREPQVNFEKIMEEYKYQSNPRRKQILSN